MFMAEPGCVKTFVETKTIPLIAIYSGDLVDGGVVMSLASPGRNISRI